MKRILITATMFLCCFATSFAQFGGQGSGTESDPYLISSPIHLNQMRNFLNKKVYFKLMNDIDLTEFLEDENPSQGWLPIGDYISNFFMGVLDGNGKTIKGLWIKRTSTECAGIFTCMQNATIKNLTIEAANIECLSGGIIAGTSTGYTTITGCSVSGEVKGKEYLGGYVGQIHYKYEYISGNDIYSGECVLSNNVGKVNVTGTGNNVGCFAGFVSVKTIMTDCTFYNGDVRGKENVGGIFGYTGGRNNGFGIVFNISNCGFFGEITGTSNVGGLIGYIKHGSKLDNEGSYIKKSFSISNIDATGDCVGGLIGHDSGTNGDETPPRKTYLDNNYYNGSVKGANNVGGIVGSKECGIITSCLATGSVEGSSYVGGIIGEGYTITAYVRRNVAIHTQVTATTDKARRIGYASAGNPGTGDENKAYNKVIVTVQGVVQDITDNRYDGAGVGAYTLKQKDTYVAMGFDFDNVWEISDGEGYPYIIGSTQIWPGDRKDVSSLTIDPIAAVTYDGSAQTPAVTVTDGATILVNGTDYTVSYSNNINAGTATVTITGEGSYKGTKTVSFTINAKSASNFTISSISPRVYTGSAQTPTVTVKDGNTTLTKGTDYTVSYSNNINIGTATVTITGIGNYTGTTTTSFTIRGSVSSLTISPIAAVTYNGSAQTPAVTVKDGSTTLISGTDYTVSYSNNINAGTATVTVTGKGNYTGTKTANFTINAKNVSGLTISDIAAVTYNGSAQTPTVTVKDGTTTLVSGTDYTISYSNNINAGTATVTVTGKGNYTDTKNASFTINAKNVSDLTINDIDAVTYNGLAQTPTVTVKDGSTTLTSGTDYTVAYSNNTNAGTATVTVTGQGNYTGTKSADFTIGKAPLTVTAKSYTITQGDALPVYEIQYNGFVNNETASVLTTAPTANCTVTPTSGPGTYDITVSGGAAANYSFNYVEGTLTINAKSASNLTIDNISSVTYNGLAQTPTVTVKDGSTTLTSGTDYTVAYSNNTNAGTATVTVTGQGNYTGTKSADFTIDKAPLIISVSNYTRKKGKDNPEFLLSYEGFKNDETEDVLTKKPTVTTTATKTSPTGDYPIEVSGAESQNYEISYVNGTLTVELLPGDANSDGELNETDRNYIVRHIMGDTPDDFDEEAANLNGDEKIDVADIVELNNLLAPKD